MAEDTDADNTPHVFVPADRHHGTCKLCGNGPDYPTHDTALLLCLRNPAVLYETKEVQQIFSAAANEIDRLRKALIGRQ